MSFRNLIFFLSFIFFISAMITLPLFSGAGKQKKTAEVVPNRDGSYPLSITNFRNHVIIKKKVLRTMSTGMTVIDFNEFTECTYLDPDALRSYRIKKVTVGPNSTEEGKILVWVHETPCDTGPLLQTLPFTGPSFLFIFNVPVSNVSIEVGDLGDSDSDEIILTAYSDEELTKVVCTNKGFISQDAPAQCIRLSCPDSCIKAIEITTESYYDSEPYPNSVYVDTLSFKPSEEVLKITMPDQEDDFDLTQNYTATSDITFEAVLEPSTLTKAINWTLDLEYRTSGGRCDGCNNQRSFNTDTNEQHSEFYESMGGQLNINASVAVNECDVQTEPVIVTITGVKIPDTLITERLVRLYHGPTARLMTGLAQVESSYMQFSTRTLYNRTDLWPRESNDGGSHIGLMQVVTTMERAWNWEINTRYGVYLFYHEKMQSARRNANRIRRLIRQKYGGHLRPLNRVELENMALIYYGPHGVRPKDMPFEEWLLTNQYYTPQQQSNGTWDWIINAHGNPRGVGYVQNVRNSIR